MTLNEIKSAVDARKTVLWNNAAYRVINGGIAGYLIECLLNGHCIGLTWEDGVTMNGNESDFYTES